MNQLSVWDLLVLAGYLTGMLVMGVVLARRQNTSDEYFLAGRRMPWIAVGISVIASLLSSLTYMSEPGEVWNSGVTHMFGKMLAIPFEMAIVYVWLIPILMRSRYTSAYEYLGDRFGRAARRLGVLLFLLLVVLWMGFVVLASARALSSVTGASLPTVIYAVGIVATAYTALGGLRAVIWTDVVQVAFLVGGGLFAIGFVAVATESGPAQWWETAAAHMQRQNSETIPWFSFDPTVRATVLTVAINMCVWHVCTHISNQMTVQRYFSTSSPAAARRSFVTGSLVGVSLNLMLMLVGLAVLHFYLRELRGDSPLAPDFRLESTLDPNLRQDRDLIYPTFAVHHLPPGLAGAVLAALLAAAMSSIDSGINSMATVLAVEFRGGGRAPEKSQSNPQSKPVSDPPSDRNAEAPPGRDTEAPPGRRVSREVSRARWLTLALGLMISLAAHQLDRLPSEWGIVDAMPRTFNAFTAPLGSMFLVGMLMPRAGQAAAVAGACVGLAVSLGLGYWKQLGDALVGQGWLEQAPASLSFTWIMPCSLAAAVAAAAVIAAVRPRVPAP